MDGTVGLIVIGTAAAIGRADHAFLIGISRIFAGFDCGTSGKCHLTLSVENGLTGIVYCHEGGRARRVYGDGRPCEL